MKQSYYFPHDYHARHDPKLERLFLTLGYEGIGIYWCLIERLYEQGGYLDIKNIMLYANGDATLCERIARVVSEFELFGKDDVKLWSDSCLKRLEKMVEKREKASKSAQKRWNNANAMPTQCEGNAINKGDKEDKVNTSHFDKFWQLYPKKVGMSMAILTFRSTVKTDQDFEDLKTALKNYMASEEYKKGYVKNGDKWIEDWRGWLQMKPKEPARRMV